MFSFSSLVDLSWIFKKITSATATTIDLYKELAGLPLSGCTKVCNQIYRLFEIGSIAYLFLKTAFGTTIFLVSCTSAHRAVEVAALFFLRSTSAN